MNLVEPNTNQLRGIVCLGACRLTWFEVVVDAFALRPVERRLINSEINRAELGLVGIWVSIALN